jgi:exonuclease III
MATQNTSNKNRSWNVLNWNVRWLNSEDKKKAVREKIEESGCSVFCLQETKMQNVDYSFIRKIALKRFSKFSFVPSLGASGGILMGWNDVLKGEIVWNQDFAITVAFTSRHSEQKWKLTTVYGPCHGE